MSDSAAPASATKTPALALPVDLWLLILDREAMSYFDLKRFSRVCKRFHELEQNPHLDSRLFRRGCTGFKQDPRVHECRKGQRVECHPVLHPTSLSCRDLQKADIVVFSKSRMTAAETEDADDGSSAEGNDAESGVRRYHPLELPVGAEYATSPPCSELVFVAGLNPVIADSAGVKVRSVIEAVTSMWASPASEEVKAAGAHSREELIDYEMWDADPEERQAAHEKMWQEIDNTCMWDTLCGRTIPPRSAECIEDGKVALQPCDFYD